MLQVRLGAELHWKNKLRPRGMTGPRSEPYAPGLPCGAPDDRRGQCLGSSPDRPASPEENDDMTTVDDLPDVWAVSATPRRPGELVTRGDVCHLHRNRDAAERCGAGFDGTPDLIRVAAINRLGRVYRVVWSLSDTAGGTLRAAPAPGCPQPGRGGKAQRDRDELAAFKAL